MKLNTEHGQGLIEFSLIALLVVTISTIALITFGPSTTELYETAFDSISAASDNETGEESLILADWVIGWGKKRWEFEDGGLQGKKNGAIFHQDFSGDDFTIKVQDANLLKGKGYGIFFRTQNPDKPEGYIFQFDSKYKGGSFTFRKWVNGKQTKPFAVQKALDFDWHDTNHDIEVAVQGNTYTAYVDGQAVLTGTDDTYSVGGIGVRTYGGAQLKIDDISVTTP